MTFWVNMNYEGWFAEFAARNNGYGLSVKGKRAILTEANMKTVYWWHTKIIPKHFDSVARSRYHYQQRKRRYRGIKQALAQGKEVYIRGQLVPPESIKKAGRVDIVRSGRTEQQAEAPTPVRATPNKAVAVLRVPRHIVRRPSAGHPDQAAEIKKLTKAEQEQLVRIWKKTFLAAVRVFGSSIVTVRKRFVSRSSGGLV